MNTCHGSQYIETEWLTWGQSADLPVRSQEKTAAPLPPIPHTTPTMHHHTDLPSCLPHALHRYSPLFTTALHHAEAALVRGHRGIRRSPCLEGPGRPVSAKRSGPAERGPETGEGEGRRRLLFWVRWFLVGFMCRTWISGKNWV